MLFHGIGFVYVKGNAGDSGHHRFFGILCHLASLFHEIGHWLFQFALAHP